MIGILLNFFFVIQSMIFSVASVQFHESCNIKFICCFFFITSSLCSVPSSYLSLRALNRNFYMKDEVVNRLLETKSRSALFQLSRSSPETIYILDHDKRSVRVDMIVTLKVIQQEPPPPPFPPHTKKNIQLSFPAT